MSFYYCIEGEGFKLSYGNDTTATKRNRIAEIGRGKKEISLSSAKGDFAAFQLVVGSDMPFTLNVGTSQYFSQYPDKDNYRVAFDFPLEGRMYIEEAFSESNGIYYSDMLSGVDARDFEELSAAAVYVHIPIPRSLEKGTYSGSIKIYRQRLFEDEVKIGEAAVSLSVKDITLPVPGKGKFYLDLWQHSSNLARHADVLLYSDEHFEVIENYLSSLASLGQRALTLVVSEIPWGGQSCYEVYNKGNLFEFSIIPITKKKNGVFEYDFTKMQRYIDIGAKLGIKDEISLYGLINIWGKALGKPCEEYSEHIRIRYFDEESASYRYMRRSEEIDAYIRALEKYFIDTKQISRVRVAADEPTDIDAFRISLNHLHEIAPSFIFKAAINTPEFIEEFSKDFGDFVPCLDALTNKFGEISEYIRTMPEKRYLWYVCCGPTHPNMFLCSPLCESWLIGILTSYFRLSGFLRWDYTVWPSDPRSDLKFRPNWKIGDMNYVYPGYNGKPLLSLRYFALLRGISFFELLEKFRSKFGVRAYNKLLSEFIPSKDKKASEVYSFDTHVLPFEEDFAALYDKLLDKLSK